MKKHFLISLLFFVLLLFVTNNLNAKRYIISSPNKRINVEINDGSSFSYSIKYGKEILLNPSIINLCFEGETENNVKINQIRRV